METDNLRREERRIGFRDETERYGFRDLMDDEPGINSGPQRSTAGNMSMGRMQHHGQNDKSEKWKKLMQKIKMHDVEHRTPESIGDVVAILYDNLPGPDQRQTELLVTIMQAIAMHCSKD